MKLSERIIELAQAMGRPKEELEAKRKQLAEVTDAYDEAKDEDGSTLVQIEELTAEVAELEPRVAEMQKQLDALRKAEELLKTKAQPVAAPNVIPHLKRDPTGEPGTLFARLHLIKALARLQEVPESAIFERHYGEDHTTKALWDAMARTKAAVPVATTTDSGWAAELVRTEMRGFLDTLKTRSVGAALATRSMMLSFDGNATITIPRMNQLGTGLTEPAWVGEGGAIPLQKFSFGAATINRYKLASIVPLTMELVEQSVPQAEVVMRNGMQEAYTIMLDSAILSATAAVAGVRPAGLLNGVTVNAGDATGGYESVVADMKTMLGAMASNRLGIRPVLLVNDQDMVSVSMLLNPLGQLMFRDETAGGRLMGIDVVSSGNVPKGTAIMVDAAQLATAFDGPQVRISQEATVVLADAGAAAPTMASDAAGALGTAGEVLPGEGIHVAGGAALGGAAGANAMAVSAFQTYSEFIRGIWPTSWTLLRPNAVVALNNLAW